MKIITLWCMIDDAMITTALATLASGLLFVASGLYAAGFYIYNLGYCYGALGAWVGASICMLSGLGVLYLFQKAYKEQKQRDRWADEPR